MREISLFTLNGNSNFGNKLQHYALQTHLNQKYNLNVDTVYCYIENPFFYKIRRLNNYIFKKRCRYFYKFDKLINYSNMYVYNNKLYNELEYNYYLIGSDQVWNTTFDTFCEKYLLKNINSNNKISYASSFGLHTLPDEHVKLFNEELQNFKCISVREDRGKEIVEDLTERSDVEVLIDPTMLLNDKEWDKVSKKPKNFKYDKYILNYFLGNVSKERMEEIKRFADENNCQIVNLMDKNDPFYYSGPSEFLWLEKNAFLICTDSFHSCVFSILYNRPFVVFDREQVGMDNMGSRIDTLINKFKLKNRRFEGKIGKENLEHNYDEAYRILEEEREKSDNFLRKALNVNDR